MEMHLPKPKHVFEAFVCVIFFFFPYQKVESEVWTQKLHSSVVVQICMSQQQRTGSKAQETHSQIWVKLRLHFTDLEILWQEVGNNKVKCVKLL